MKSITHETGNDLHKETWHYWFNDSRLKLILDWYKMEDRPTKRHGWKVVCKLERGYGQMSDVAMPVPDEVRAEVLRKFRELITIEGD
jgi:hypothetical protein